MATPSQDRSSPARRDHFLALAATGMTCLALCLPGDSISPLEQELSWALPPHADKIVHVSLFFFETLCLHRSLRWWPKYPAIRLAVALAAALAVATEVLQGFIPRRNTDGLDLVANGVGILAFVLAHLIRRRQRRGVPHGVT